MHGRRPYGDRKCPCGSGRLRRTCDPRVLIPCIDCGGLFHQTCNRAVRCPKCRPLHNRKLNTEKNRRWRASRRTAAGGS